MDLSSKFSPLGRHWRGEYGLVATLTVGLLIPSAILFLATQKLSADKLNAEQSIIHVAIGIIALSIYIALITCTIISINRKSRLSNVEYGVGATIAASNSLAFVVALYTILQIVDLIAVAPTPSVTLAKLYEPLDYQLQNNNQSILHASGEIGNTSTLELQKIISENKNISKIILNSKGGNVFEARGIARVIRENQLDTHVTENCYSACTLAFVSGLNRTADADATFGFHAYKLNSLGTTYQINVESEQAKDALLFTQNGVDQSFVDRMFRTDHADIWIPGRDVLMSSGFLTHR